MREVGERLPALPCLALADRKRVNFLKGRRATANAQGVGAAVLRDGHAVTANGRPSYSAPSIVTAVGFE